MSKEERSELNWKLESTEDKEDSPEVNVSVMTNLQTKLHSAAPDEQPPLEQFEEEPAEDLDEATMQNDSSIKFVIKNVFTFVKSASLVLWCRAVFYVTKIVVQKN